MTIRCATALILACTASLAPAQTAMVQIGPSGGGAFTGSGLVAGTANGCMIVTVAHILNGVQGADWRQPVDRGASPRGTARARTADESEDYAVLEFGEPFADCRPLPSEKEIAARIVPDAAASIYLTRSDGSLQIMRGRVTRIDDRQIGISVPGGAARGDSGSPVLIDGVQVGLLKGAPVAGSDLLTVVRLDRLMRIDGGRWLAPPVDAALDGRSAAELFWTGIGLQGAGRPASARVAFERAGQAGSIAARMSLVSMLREGEGGPREDVRAATLEETNQKALFTEAERGDTTAALTLAADFAHGALVPADRDRAAAIVKAKTASLEIAARSGTGIAATQLALLRLTASAFTVGSFNAEIARRLGGKVDPTEGPTIGTVCATVTCTINAMHEIYAGLVDAMENGNEVAAIGLTAFGGLGRRDIVDPKATIGIPDCSVFGTRTPNTPLKAIALASCTDVRRMIAFGRFDPIALDDRGEDLAIVAAFDAGAYPSESRFRWMRSAYRNDYFAKSEVVMQRAAERELNTTATLDRIDRRLGRGENLGKIVADLYAVLARLPAAKDDEVRARALGRLAAALMLGDTTSAIDFAGLRETIVRIRALDPAAMMIARGAMIYAATNYWSEANRQRSDYQKIGDEFLDLAARAGNADAVMTAYDEGKIPARKLRRENGAPKSTYLSAVAETSPSGAADILCDVEADVAGHEKTSAAALKFCERLVDIKPVTSLAVARIYDALKRPNDALKVLERAAALGSRDPTITLADRLSRGKAPDYVRVHSLLRSAISMGDTSALHGLMRFILDGKIADRDPAGKISNYFGYLVAMADAMDVGLTCEKAAADKGCVILFNGIEMAAETTAVRTVKTPNGGYTPFLSTIDAAHMRTLRAMLEKVGSPLFETVVPPAQPAKGALSD